MNWNIVDGNWKQLTGKVKSQWGRLKDDHREVLACRGGELSGGVQEAFGITKDESKPQMKRFEDRKKHRQAMKQS